MKLYIADTIRRLRLARNMTQEQLADALGVSFQSVSRWESGTNYPDVELIPEIAVYFGISTDDLIGLTGAVREEKLREAWRALDEAEKAGNTRERLDLLRRMRRDFPQDPDVLWTLAYAMSEFPELYEEQKALTEQFLALPDAKHDFTAKRNDENILIYALFESAPDEDLQNLLDRYSTENIDMTRTALLNARYLAQEKWDGYEDTRQIKLREILFELIDDKLRKGYHASASDSAWAQQKSLEILNLLTDYKGEKLMNPAPDLWFDRKYSLGYRLSCALASSGRKEEALSVLEDTVVLIENFAALPAGTELTYECPSLDSFRCSIVSRDDGGEQPDTGNAIPLMRLAYHRGDHFLDEVVIAVTLRPLLERDGWEWFDPIREEPRFLSCIKRVEALRESKLSGKADE